MSQKINVVNQKISLDEAQFKRLPPAKIPARAVLLDEILDFNLKGNTIGFKYKRLLKVDPESIYQVFVSFSYESEISEESAVVLRSAGKFNVEYLKEKAPSIAESTQLCSVASQIISNLTSINGGRPFISPPVFIKK